MKQKRAKQYRKNIQLLQNTFGFRAPYQVLVTADFLLHVVETKINLTKYLCNTIQISNWDDLRIMISQCAMKELYDSRNNEAIDLAKGLERRRCGHMGVTTRYTDDCIWECITGRETRTITEVEAIREGYKMAKEKANNKQENKDDKSSDEKGNETNDNDNNNKSSERSHNSNTSNEATTKKKYGPLSNKHHLFVATQSSTLRQRLRNVPATPLIYVSRSVMLMEPLSDVTTRVRVLAEEKKLTGGLNDPNAGKRVRDTEDDKEAEKKKKRKVKGVNPLSVKKKVDTGATGASPATGGDVEGEKKKVRRKRPTKKTEGDADFTTASSNAPVAEAME
ncbi:hypothetical protein NADFUDRAFT_51277 [Nadsonia fulvescens var. elongata DSM 6958]|uniref:UTP23 sensor motif region domain-containing protein n=1 Tax=Nadsonia fulvescens var. elongata DSM 6958 TaxID=857566 RepID=A0A1E3PMF4_9ASCO|nr:hypothetical protein NADFUDRAFT_51277 [Nadsonia fulvescens var. elongata DSM 6958]